MEQYKVISDHVDYLIIEDEKGNQRKALKIKKEDVQKIRYDLNRKVANNLDKKDVQELCEKLTTILNDVPRVTEFEKVAGELANYLRKLYDKVGNPNQFHHPIKNIDPDIYGKPRVFMKEIVQLYETMIEVAKMMKDMGKISGVETLQIPHVKYTLSVKKNVTIESKIRQQLQDLQNENKEDNILNIENIFRTFVKIY